MQRRYLAGDVVARRKWLVMHKGVALGDGRVLHNTPSRGVHISSEEEFLQGRSLQVAAKPQHERRRALVHAKQHHRGDVCEAGGYNLFTNNCEHLVTRAHSGRSSSPQLISWVAGLSLAAVVLVATRHPGIAAAGFTLGRTLGSAYAERIGEKS